MDVSITEHGPNPAFQREGGETLQIEKVGGKLGECSRFYTVSRISDDLIVDPLQKVFINTVDALGALLDKPSGNARAECLAFRIPALNEAPEDWGEVAGYNWNGASIEQVVEEIRRNEDL